MRWGGWISRCAEAANACSRSLTRKEFAICSRGRGDRTERKTVAQSTRVCLIEPLGARKQRGNCQPFVVPVRNWALSNIGTGHMRSKIGALALLLVGFLLASCASPRGL